MKVSDNQLLQLDEANEALLKKTGDLESLDQLLAVDTVPFKWL